MLSDDYALEPESPLALVTITNAGRSVTILSDISLAISIGKHAHPSHGDVPLLNSRILLPKQHNYTRDVLDDAQPASRKPVT